MVDEEKKRQVDDFVVV